MKWFDNPRKRRKTRRRKRRAPKGGWKKYMAKLRAMKGRKHRKHRTGGTMARRKRRRAHNRPRRRRRATNRRHVVRHRRRSNPRRHRRYSRRRNPGLGRFSVGGVMSRVKSGAIDGVWVVGGKAVTNAIPSLIGLAPTGGLGLAIKALSAVVAGYLFGMVSSNAGKLATAAGFASIYEPFLRGLPVIGPALSADDDYGAYPLYGSYPEEISAPGVGSYPEVGVGAEEAAYYQ